MQLATMNVLAAHKHKLSWRACTLQGVDLKEGVVLNL